MVKGYKHRKVTAYRDFPAQCGRNVMLKHGPSEIEWQNEVEGHPVPGELNEVDGLNFVHNSDIKEAKCVSDAAASVPSALLPGGSNSLSLTHEYIKPESAVRMKKKYRRRKVFAVRDFPPNCGSNVSLAASGINCIVSVATKTVRSSGKVIKSDIDDVEGNDFSAENKSSGELVHGLMAAPYCPWRKGKASLHSSGSGPREGKLKQHKWKAGPVTSGDTPEERGGGLSNKKRPFSDHSDADGSRNSSTFLDDEDCGAYTRSPAEIAPTSMFQPDIEYSNEDSAGSLEKMFTDSPGKSDDGMSSHSAFSSAEDEDRDAGQGSMSAVNSKLKKNKVFSSNSVGATGKEVSEINLLWRKKSKTVARKSTGSGDFSMGSSVKPRGGPASNDGERPNDGGLHAHSPVSKKKKDLIIRLPAFSKKKKDFDVRLPPVSKKKKDFDVRLPPFRPNRNNHGDARNKVRETLRLFNGICRKLLQKEEGNSVPGEECMSKLSGKKLKRIDLVAAKMIKDC